MITHHSFQEKIINQVHDFVSKIVSNDADLGFSIGALIQAPTGSGKTFMCAEAIKRLLSTNKNLMFLWISVGNGENVAQSYNSFTNKFNVANCSIYDSNNNFSHNSNIIFTSWNFLKDSSKNGPTNFFAKKNGLTQSLKTFLDSTRLQKNIIVFIDESHHTANSSLSKEIIETIKPKIVIEVTATPTNSGYAKHFLVTNEEVRGSGIIKENIKLNDYDETTTSNGGLDLILKSAEKKRKEILERYESMGINNIQPLVLIQCKENDADDIAKYLKNNLNIRNNEIGYNFAKRKENIDGITNSNNQVKYLLCYHTIAIGWDCPRAHILVQLIKTGNEGFEIQVVGRVLRTVEQKKYEDFLLDTAFIYTYEEDNQSYIKKFIENKNNLPPSILVKQISGKETLVDSINALFKNKSILKEDYIEKSAYLVFTEKGLLNLQNLYFQYLSNNLSKQKPGNTFGKYKIEYTSTTVDVLTKKVEKEKDTKIYVTKNFDGYCQDMVKKYNLKMIDLSKLIIPYKDKFINEVNDFQETIFYLTSKFLSEQSSIIEYSNEYLLKYEYDIIKPSQEEKYIKNIYSEISKGLFIQKLYETEKCFINQYLEPGKFVVGWVKNFDWGNNGLCFLYRSKDTEKPSRHFPDFIVLEKVDDIDIIHLYEIKEYTDSELNDVDINNKWNWLKNKELTEGKFKYDLFYIDVQNKKLFQKNLTGAALITNII